MTRAREAFQDIMHFRDAEYLPLFEWGWWPATLNRWHAEGLPYSFVDTYSYVDDCLNPASVQKYLGLDAIEYIMLNTGPIPSMVSEITYEDERSRIVVSRVAGLKWVTKEMKDGTSMPQFIEFGLKTREDWEKFKRLLDPYDKRRYPKNWGEDLFDYYAKTDKIVDLHCFSVYGNLRNWMGLENILINFYKDPELMKEVIDYYVDFQIELSRPALENARIDYAFIWEDMCYKNGPHMSPKIFREFLLPGYKKITRFIRKHGVDIIAVDSDGNLDLVIPLLIEGGVNCILPLEVQAGMDAPALRKKYGRQLLMMGNIDKRAIAAGKEVLGMDEVRVRQNRAKR